MNPWPRIQEGMEDAERLISKSSVVTVEEAGELEFGRRLRIYKRSPWIGFLDRLLDLKKGEAIALDLEKIPLALKKAAQSQGVELEFARTGGKILVRARVSDV